MDEVVKYYLDNKDTIEFVKEHGDLIYKAMALSIEKFALERMKERRITEENYKSGELQNKEIENNKKEIDILKNKINELEDKIEDLEHGLNQSKLKNFIEINTNI